MNLTIHTRALRLLVLLLLLENVVLAMVDYRAASKGAHLRRRDSSMEPRYEIHSLLYATYDSEDDEIPQSAVKISFRPKLPTVILEDTMAYDAGIYCDTTHISIYLADQELMRSIRNTWAAHSEFILVTSRPGCAAEGEHSAYIVKTPSYHENRNLVTLEATRMSIKECTERIDFDMGDHVIPHVHRRLKRRDALPQKASTTVSTPSSSLPAPITTVTAPSSEGDIGFSRKNLQLFPPDSSIVNLVPPLQALNGLNITCKDCSMAGKLKLEVAGFSLDTNRLDAAMDFLDDGYFQFSAKGMKATMAFEFNFAPGFALPGPGFVPQLPPINLIGLSVRGVFTFGPQLRLTFPIEVTLNSPVKYTTGFTFDVPDNSKIVLNISDVDSSYSTGFQDAKLEPLPWNFNAPDFSLNFTAGFRPILELAAGIGIENGPVSASGSVGVFLDLPSYTAVVTTVYNKSENCMDAAPRNETNIRFHVEPFQFFRAGTIYDVEFSLLGQEVGIHNLTNLAEIRRDLPEQCLLFNRRTNSVDQSPTIHGISRGTSDADLSQPSIWAAGLVFIAACFALL